jgi:hypothetical protein
MRVEVLLLVGLLTAKPEPVPVVHGERATQWYRRPAWPELLSRRTATASRRDEHRVQESL